MVEAAVWGSQFALAPTAPAGRRRCSTGPRRIRRRGARSTLSPAMTRIATAAAVVTPTCSEPPSATVRQMKRRRESENSSPIAKSRKITPTSAICVMCSVSSMRCRPCGPATLPVIRKPMVAGRPSRCRPSRGRHGEQADHRQVADQCVLLHRATSGQAPRRYQATSCIARCAASASAARGVRGSAPVRAGRAVSGCGGFSGRSSRSLSASCAISRPVR